MGDDGASKDVHINDDHHHNVNENIRQVRRERQNKGYDRMCPISSQLYSWWDDEIAELQRNDEDEEDENEEKNEEEL